MVTDDDRRRVAAKLREYASWDEERGLVDCQEWGESVLNLLDCGDTEGENYAYLADLIDPDTTSDMTKSQTTSLSPSPCDRDKLLELADAVEEARDALPYKTVDWTDVVTINRSMFGDIARRIREACGVTADA